MPTLRLASPDDAPALLAIYAPIVTDTAISFELAPPSVAEFAERIARTLEAHPWILAEMDGALAGYAYGTRHRARAAYDRTVETSIFVGADHRGRGIGRRLYRVLFELLRIQGFQTAVAGITMPNDASEAMHRAAGFDVVGRFPRLGWKFEQWHDTLWMQRPVDPENADAPARPLRTPAEVRDTEAWRAAFEVE